MRFRVRLSPSFVPKVEQGGPGMVKQHARAGVAHDGSHLPAHPGAVTMDGALLAGGFLFAVAAMREAGMGIFQKCLEGVRLMVLMMVSLIKYPEKCEFFAAKLRIKSDKQKNVAKLLADRRFREMA